MLLLILLHAFFVSFSDKPEKTVPQLSPRAIEQRAKWGIGTDEKDYPVSALYTDSLRRMGATIYHSSRWFNGVTCEMDSTLAQKVAGLRFVTGVELTRDNNRSSRFMPKRLRIPKCVSAEEATRAADTDAQLKLFNLLKLHEAGYEGEGILMAVCDGGFQKANTLSVFRQTQELGHFDFTDDTDGFYGSTGGHGTKCLSVISGIETDFYGAATQSDYYLMRSEENDTESRKEMDNLVAALEKADSLGVNVFSVSLGYEQFDDYRDLDKTKDLDGKSTRCSRAATIAARKGMLVCVAAGNEGDDAWGTLGAPADADSVLTVGAVNVNGKIGSFSSYGPSSDGRIKPEVCAVGVSALVWSPYGYGTYSDGTSFATPLLAGLASALWSALPDENAMQIRERIIRSSDRYTSPDTNNYKYGYGIPDAWKAYTMELPQGIDDVESQEPKAKSQKILRNGQLLIIRNGETYSVTGGKIVN